MAAPGLKVEMGCDGGSIQKRSEMVKTKCKTERFDDTEMLKTQWTCCFISKKPLESPVVTCKLGRLYNKDAAVMFLLNSEVTDSAVANELSHIKSLKSFFNCNLKSPEKSTKSEYFVCPITGREMNGKSKFYVIKTCGCVLSEQALNQFPDTKTCLVCEKDDFNRGTDLIQLYPKIVKMATCSAKKRTIIEENGSILEEVKCSSAREDILAVKRSKVIESLYRK